MAIQDLINPDLFDGQTGPAIFVKDVVTGSLMLIDDDDHNFDHELVRRHPENSDYGNTVTGGLSDDFMNG